MTVGAFISGHRDVALVVIFELTDMILCVQIELAVWVNSRNECRK